MTAVDVAVFGIACCDIIFHGLPSFPKLGEEVWTEGVVVTAGGAMNTAVAQTRLGLNVGLATPVGDDFFGQLIVSKMKEERLSLDFAYFVEKPYPQVSVALNYNGDRSFVSYGDEQEQRDYFRHLNRVVETVDANVCQFYTSSREGYTTLMAKAKDRGKRIVLDSGWDPDWLGSDGIKEQIQLADVFMPNLLEAQTITGQRDPYQALEALSRLTPTVVIKLGEKGAVGKYAGDVYVSEAPVVKAIDTTGAGDCFVAGFLYTWINRMPFSQCLDIANYCGSQAVTAVGGYTGAPTKKQIHDLFLTENGVKISK